MKKLETENLINILLFAGTFVTFIIGIDQTIRFGIINSYWIFTFSVGFLLVYNLRRQRITEKQAKEAPKPVVSKPLIQKKSNKKATQKSP
ncbi:MAG: hypothetical protein H7Y04_13480 [Verrucomicrobia bacterium]|nr:hypothetical protein [Cytophagales bacterium]